MKKNLIKLLTVLNLNLEGNNSLNPTMNSSVYNKINTSKKIKISPLLKYGFYTSQTLKEASFILTIYQERKILEEMQKKTAIPFKDFSIEDFLEKVYYLSLGQWIYFMITTDFIKLSSYSHTFIFSGLIIFAVNFYFYKKKMKYILMQKVLLQIFLVQKELEDLSKVYTQKIIMDGALPALTILFRYLITAEVKKQTNIQLKEINSTMNF